MTREPTTILDAFAERLASDPDGPYLEFAGHESVRLTAREMDRAVESPRARVPCDGRCRRRPGRDPAREPSRAGDFVLRGDQDRCDPGTDQHRVQGRVPPSPARGLRRQGLRRPGRLCVPADRGRGRRRDARPCAVITVDPPDAEIDVRPVTTWQDALAAGSDAPITGVAVRPADLACLIYTAGTTGPSKGCMLSHNYVVSLADQITRVLGRRPDDIVLTPLPLFHFNAISICVVGTLLAGGSAAIERRFSVSNFWPEVRRTQATIVTCSARSRP